MWYWNYGGGHGDMFHVFISNLKWKFVYIFRFIVAVDIMVDIMDMDEIKMNMDETKLVMKLVMKLDVKLEMKLVMKLDMKLDMKLVMKLNMMVLLVVDII